jgi:HK97 family phage major capsid protein
MPIDGRPLWVPSMREGEPGTLLGRPAIMSDRNPQLGSLGDLWYGDLSQYLIKDGSGPFVAASEHVLFKQNKTMIKIFWNVDGSHWLTAPFQLENGYLTSPFVALDVPSV